MNHGIQTLYEFAEDTGGMERSDYFGFSKDLYHFDHFMGTSAKPLKLWLTCVSNLKPTPVSSQRNS
jgi:hypothetical protein